MAGNQRFSSRSRSEQSLGDLCVGCDAQMGELLEIGQPPDHSKQIGDICAFYGKDDERRRGHGTRSLDKSAIAGSDWPMITAIPNFVYFKTGLSMHSDAGLANVTALIQISGLAPRR